MKMEIFFSKNHAENEAGRLASRPLYFSKKLLLEVKAYGLELSFNIQQ